MATTATSKQLRYLKALADRTGQTFTYPHTPREASREIARLKGTRSPTRTERYVERKAIADQIATGPLHDSTRVREEEISGRGSSATWTHNRDQEPTVDTGRPPARRMTPVIGPRTELGRYQISEGERVLYGQRIDGVVRVVDRPAQPGGRAFLVERGLEGKAELDALVSDYIAQAQRLDTPPLAAAPALAGLIEAAA